MWSAGNTLTLYMGTSGFVNEFRILVAQATAVPEPASLTLLGLGAICTLGYGWRRRRQQAA
jgi:hypothetical protein